MSEESTVYGPEYRYVNPDVPPPPLPVLVGHIVHYVSGGKCRAAIVIELGELVPQLHVFEDGDGYSVQALYCEHVHEGTFHCLENCNVH
jgi:hypothetical protein